MTEQRYDDTALRREYEEGIGKPPCLICGKTWNQHNGAERFCPIYATYRPDPNAKPKQRTGIVEFLRVYRLAAIPEPTLPADGQDGQ
jgi:hypothetical protein